MHNKHVGVIVLTVVGAGAAYWLYKTMQANTAPATAAGVTNTAKTGGIVTTPFFRQIAAVLIRDPLSWAGNAAARAASLIPGGLSNGSAPVDWRIPFGNRESQAAAGAAPKATNISNYRPTSWASIPFRSGV